MLVAPELRRPGAPATVCGCTYPCVDDAECGAGNVCVCGGVVTNYLHPWAMCAPATCTTTAGCASSQCGVVYVEGACGFGQPALACRNDADSCRVDTDCAMPSPYCAINPSTPATWSCWGPPPCGIGRPLLAGGRARTARAAARDDWAAGDAGVDTGDLDAPTRAALGRHWTAVAALEHASVASFARFTLHLLVLGAPPSLVAEAQRAGLDEVEHATPARAGAAHGSRARPRVGARARGDPRGGAARRGGALHGRRAGGGAREELTEGRRRRHPARRGLVLGRRRAFDWQRARVR